MTPDVKQQADSIWEGNMLHKVIHPDYPEYFIHADGSVERRIDSNGYHKAGDFLSGRVLVSGYRQFKLVTKDGPRKLVRANRLVCEAFHGVAPTTEHHAAHRNGIKTDNRAENLYWATPKENGQDKIKHGTQARGEKVGTSALTDDLVAAIRNEYNGKRGSKTYLARKYGVSLHAVSSALSGETWSHVEAVTSQPQRLWDRLSDDEKVTAVKLLASHALTYSEVAEKLEASRDAVSHFAQKAGVCFLPVNEKQEYYGQRRAA